jgi:PAS domain S-box-containing protein
MERIFYISPSFERIWGRSRESLYENPPSFLDAVHVEDRDRVLAGLEIKKTGQPFDNEYRIILPDGNIRHIWDRGFPIRDENGQISSYAGIAMDITESKLAEELLRHQKEMLQIIFDSIPVMVTFFDREGRYQLINRCWQSTLGLSLEEMLQHKDIFAEFYPDPEYREYVLNYIKGAAGAEIWSDFKTRARDGRVLDTSWSNVLLSDGSIIGIGIDISDRKRVEEESIRYAKELEDANTALRVFMGRRDNDQKMLEDKLQININELVLPYLKKIMDTTLDSRQKNYIGVLESNLNNIVSPYILNLSANYKNLTPQEIQIANLIRQGKNTKSIAELLGTSVHTIGTHRNNIRKKLKLRNSKENLRSCLLSHP